MGSSEIVQLASVHACGN